MARRSEPRQGCPYCKGSGVVMVTKDPDTEIECPCTDPPRRVQLSRRRGWRKPQNTVIVSRPSKWGNPVKRGDLWCGIPVQTNTELVTAFRSLCTENPAYVAEVRAQLAGKNLACWCPLDQPCHADVLLEIANGDG
ncbi:MULTISPECIES: DUF4326 domain-containing protein [unclassified Microbacterium]|uniref:DUF4326 domain-containing protein n=1 Tax=unclassified Microbacterium TaxID=2609290 RepID=UPI00364BB2CC